MQLSVSNGLVGLVAVNVTLLVPILLQSKLEISIDRFPALPPLSTSLAEIIAFPFPFSVIVIS